jgi:hypothetical protein
MPRRRGKRISRSSAGRTSATSCRHRPRWRAASRCARRGSSIQRPRPRRVGGPVGLHIDRLLHALPGDVGQVFGHRIVAADRLVGAEDARLHRARQPGQVRLPPDVEMASTALMPARPSRRRGSRGDGGRGPAVAQPVEHRQDRPHRARSRAGRPGRRRAATATAPTTRAPRSRAMAATSASGPAAFQPVRDDDHQRAPGEGAKRGTDRKTASASPSRVPPSQSATSPEASTSACRGRGASARG